MREGGREVAPRRFREVSGRNFEEFVVGHSYGHRPGRTITDADNVWFTLPTMNTHPAHFDCEIATKTEFGKPLVELDGSQHADNVAYDMKRTRFCEGEGYRVARFWNNDLFLNMDGVLAAILEAVAAPLPGASRLSLPPEREGG